MKEELNEGQQKDQSKNRFLLSKCVAQRARQIQQGARPLIDSQSESPVITAMNEFQKGVVSYDMKSEPELVIPEDRIEPDKGFVDADDVEISSKAVSKAD